MDFIEFRDTCIISRGGEKDAWDNDVNPQCVYSGPCLYQEGGVEYSRGSIVTKAPVVFLPDVPTEVRINDSVVITTEFGRKVEAVSENVRDINLPWQSNIKCTRIELKQAQGK